MNSLTRFTSVPRTQRSQLDYILLDASGSMRDKWWDSLAAIDSYIAGIKAQPDINSQVMLTSFTSVAGYDSSGSYGERHVEYLLRDTPIQQWVPLSQDPVGADWGGTPLLDAINNMARFAAQADPVRGSFIVVTDGEESGSRFTTWDQAKSMLDWMRAKGWQITFIGCDFDNTSIASRLGAGKGQSIGVAQANLKLAASALASKRVAYGRSGQDMEYTDDESRRFGGYLGSK